MISKAVEDMMSRIQHLSREAIARDLFSVEEGVIPIQNKNIHLPGKTAIAQRESQPTTGLHPSELGPHLEDTKVG